MKVAAGVITYNPDVSRLKDCILSVVKQVDTLFVYDNCSSNIDEIQKAIYDIKKVELILADKNNGVSFGLNQIVKACLDNQFHWLLALDQDSLCPYNLIASLSHYASTDCAIVCPQTIDRRLHYKNDFANHNNQPHIEYVDRCITAGSLLNLDVCKLIGGFDDFLFIDFVDFEYCFRAAANGYKILRVNTVILEQEFGEMVTAKHADIFIRFGRFFKSSFIMRFALKKKYSPIRKYYTIRNLWYCQKKYPSKYTNMEAWKLSIELVLKVLIFADNRFDVVLAILKGIKDGRKLKVITYTPNV